MTDAETRPEAETDPDPDPETETASSAGESDAVPPQRRRSRPAWMRNRLATALAAALVLSAVTAGSVYWFVYRPDRLTDAAAQEEVLAAAREGAEAVLTYSPDSVDKNLEVAKSHLTGEFLKRYADFADSVVGPAAKERGVKTEANVARAAVSEMRPGTARVLVFVNQVTTSKQRPTPSLATSSVMMTLVKTPQGWLISEFNPI